MALSPSAVRSSGELSVPVPGLAGALDVSVQAVKERACELGHSDSCYRGVRGRPRDRP